MSTHEIHQASSFGDSHAYQMQQTILSSLVHADDQHPDVYNTPDGYNITKDDLISLPGDLRGCRCMNMWIEMWTVPVHPVVKFNSSAPKEIPNHAMLRFDFVNLHGRHCGIRIGVLPDWDLEEPLVVTHEGFLLPGKLVAMPMTKEDIRLSEARSYVFPLKIEQTVTDILQFIMSKQLGSFDFLARDLLWGGNDFVMQTFHQLVAGGYISPYIEYAHPFDDWNQYISTGYMALATHVTADNLTFPTKVFKGRFRFYHRIQLPWMCY
ncbi:uncharacterized protein F4822DRAFT_445028 [Hypoxylon trugodes]|uniref:uncharacterized protein n=1 Tax=Hypoxylon trugodes TaxID=326681 RepID=UPI0021918728|nr:uncharacterized protein F4822DRAFT_445028 [Hypoxylon trugodes]KAI1386778.1 hypothetical protein F4822DRAFT_445028 [Hypoxylon trugodes]